MAQKVIVPEKGIGMIPIAVYSLNAKKVATETLYVIQVKKMLWYMKSTMYDVCVLTRRVWRFKHGSGWISIETGWNLPMTKWNGRWWFL